MQATADKRVGMLLGGQDRVLTVEEQTTVAEAAQAMQRHQVGCLVAVDSENKIVGILTERDIINEVVARSVDPDKVPICEIMTTEVVCCDTHTTVTKAQEIMARHSIRHLPIVQGGTPVGMISIRDILAHQLSAVQAIVRRQSRVLQHLETQHPGITQLQTDRAGRIVI
jgi:signal-transduction protein with cAMP-binding, CBS, and nucleotidyltransferase domain